MSRIGLLPIEVPTSVTVTIDGSSVKVKGPKGELEHNIPNKISAELKDGILVVSRENDEKEAKSLHGLTRTLINNMVIGVQDGFKKDLEIIGTGYRVSKKGNDLEFALGFSHPVTVVAPEFISFAVEGNTNISVLGINKQQVGEVAANIRKLRPPEPYKGKGIRYVGEFVARKAGKAGKK